MILEKTRFSQSAVPIHRYVRMTTNTVPITPSTGWNAAGFDLEISFSLNNTSFYIGGVLAGTAANPGASDFTALYDFYRLESVEVSLMYGANMFAPGTAAVAQLPIMNIAFDPSDLSVTSLSSILQYQNLRTVQLGNQRTQNGYVVSCKPRPLLTGGGSATAVVETNPWLNKDTPTIPYYGLKIFYDNAGSTAATVIGIVSFYIKYHWAFRLSQ
jgi:hypothetical protein